MVFTDIRGYTTMMARDEALTVRLVNEHRALVREIVAAHGGREHETIGDAFVLLFRSATDAVACCLALQGRLCARNREVGEAERLWVRIGIHLDDVIVSGATDTPSDIFGEGVNLAARVEPLARPGGICVTDPVWKAVRGRLPIRATPQPHSRLKNVVSPPPLWQLDVPGALPAPREPWATPRVAVLAASLLLGLSLLASQVRADHAPTANTPYVPALDAPPDAQSAFNEGWTRIRAGDAAAALPFLDRAVALAPDQPYLRVLRTYAASETWSDWGYVVRGLEEAHAASARSPGSPGADLARLLARLHGERAHPEGLFADFDTWFAAHPRDGVARAIVADLVVSFGAGTVDQWRRLADAATRADPGCTLSWLVLGWGEVYQGGDLAAASHAAEAALALVPNAPDGLALQAQVARRQGNLAGARATMFEAVRASPAVADLRFELARVCLELGDERCRQEQLRWAESEVTDVRSRVSFTQAHAAHLAEFGRVREARALFAEACPAAEAIPDHVSAFWCHDLQLRQWRLGLDDDVEAIRRAQSEVLNQPDVPDSERRRFAVQVQWQRAAAKLQAGDSPGADTLITALEAIPDDEFAYGHQRDRVRELRARWLVATGNAEAGRATALEVKSPCWRPVLVARAELTLGNLAQALAAADTPLRDTACSDHQVRPDVADVLVGVGESALAGGEPALATRALDAYRRTWPHPDTDTPIARRAERLSASLSRAVKPRGG